jgi:hypothetical protein
MDYAHLPTERLRSLCKERHLEIGKGKKHDLIAKLVAFDRSAPVSEDFREEMKGGRVKGKGGRNKKQAREAVGGEEEIEEVEVKADRHVEEPKEQVNLQKLQSNKQGRERKQGWAESSTQNASTDNPAPPKGSKPEQILTAPKREKVAERAEKQEKEEKQESDEVEEEGEEEEEERQWRSPSKLKGGKLPIEAELSPNSKSKRKNKHRNDAKRLRTLTGDSGSSDPFPAVVLSEDEGRLDMKKEEKVTHGEEEDNPQDENIDTLNLSRLRELCQAKGLLDASKTKRKDLVTWLHRHRHSPTSPDIAAAAVPNSTPPPSKSPQQSPGASKGGKYHGMSVPELKKECKQRGLVGYRKIGKHDIIALLENHDAEQSEADSSNTPTSSSKPHTHSNQSTQDDDNLREELEQQCRSSGFISQPWHTVDDLRARLSVSKEMERKVTEELSSSSSFLQLRQTSNTFARESGYISFVSPKHAPVSNATKKKQTLLLPVETSMLPKHRLDVLQTCYGPLQTHHQTHVSRAKLVKRWLRVLCEEGLKGFGVVEEKVACRNKDSCHDAAHKEWIVVEGEKREQDVIKLVQLAVVYASWK